MDQYVVCVERGGLFLQGFIRQPGHCGPLGVQQQREQVGRLPIDHRLQRGQGVEAVAPEVHSHEVAGNAGTALGQCLVELALSDRLGGDKGLAGPQATNRLQAQGLGPLLPCDEAVADKGVGEKFARMGGVAEEMGRVATQEVAPPHLPKCMQHEDAGTLRLVELEQDLPPRFTPQVAAEGGSGK